LEACRLANESWDEADGVEVDQSLVHPGRPVDDLARNDAWYSAFTAAIHYFAMTDTQPFRFMLERRGELNDDAEAPLLHDIFGNPFRTVLVDPSWLAWNGKTVLKLARGIYVGRAFDRLPILADALEDAGCTNADILDHCRGPGPHVRGCWVI